MKRESNTRRNFLKTTAAGALAAPWIGWQSTALGAPPSETVRYAVFGSAGRAWSNIQSMAAVPGVQLVAAADSDLSRTDKLRKEFPETRIYQDWRELLEKEENNIDAVLVSTPDHMHAPIAMSALQLGKHCYGEKPLTRTLHESRRLREVAAENKLVTQMGIQIAATTGNLAAAQWIAEGRIGKVQKIFSRCPKSWGSMEPLSSESREAPASLDWDGWIGVSKERDFLPGQFHPGQWRKRIGYGTGTLGDMGCHIFHPWFHGLGSPDVLSVVSEGPAPVDKDSWPLNGKVRYTMKGNELTDGDFEFLWCDGDQEVERDFVEAVGGMRTRGDGEQIHDVPKTGSVIIGSEGTLVHTHVKSPPVIYREGKVEETPSDLPESYNHHGEFVEAIRSGDPSATRVNWNYASPLTDAVLLGCVATLMPGEKLEWDASAFQFTGNEAANRRIHEPYREGWEVAGI